MSDKSGFANRKFRSHFLVEMILVAALVFYMVMAHGKPVGDDIGFTVAGVSLMALVTYWTLNTLKDGLEVIALRAGKLRH
ncbi:MAG TPA: hypothetical protein VL091_14150 [Marinobacter sp.]|nr:hypothetical protein [Marinobacter sp.]